MHRVWITYFLLLSLGCPSVTVFPTQPLKKQPKPPGLSAGMLPSPTPAIWQARRLFRSILSFLTPITISREDPPNAMLASPLYLNIVAMQLISIGSPATMQRKNAPINVILPSILLIYFAVGSPGRTPGIIPPFFLRLFETSVGSNEIIM